MQNTKAKIGTVSKATHRNEDIIPSFLEELKRLDEGNDFFKAEIKETESFIKRAKKDRAIWTSDEAQWTIEDLQYGLEEYAPPYCYFGAHEGNGSDFGFWPDTYSLQEDMKSSHNQLHSDKFSENLEGQFIVEVNGHGNTTLKRITGIETEIVWDIV